MKQLPCQSLMLTAQRRESALCCVNRCLQRSWTPMPRASGTALAKPTACSDVRESLIRRDQRLSSPHRRLQPRQARI